MKTTFCLLTVALIGLNFSALAQNPFITTWKTDNPGTSNSTSITIPTYSLSTYDYDVDWDGDGTFDEFGITGDATHDLMHITNEKLSKTVKIQVAH